MPLSRSQIIDLMMARSPVVAADLVEALANFLTVAREIVQQDADKVLLLLVIILRSTQHPDYRKLTPPDIASGQIETLPTLGVNLRSLAESTGIPKETVRRKVQSLVDARWVERHEGDLRATSEAYRAVAPAREALLRMAVRNYEAVGRLVREAEAQR